MNVKNKKRLAVFAGYDKYGIINDYVIYYLKELKKVADIIFVYDNSFSEEELLKIKGLTIKNICKSHGEYDFGSYKRGYQWAEKQGLLEQYDSLTLCNDSVFGPFKTLLSIYKKFEKDGACDFWGFSNNTLSDGGEFYKKLGIEGKSHLESWFVVFNKNVFSSKSFMKFIKGIKKETEKNNIIKKYEVGMTRILVDAGFNFKALTVDAGIYDKIKKTGFIKKTWFNPKDNGFRFIYNRYQRLTPSKYNIDLIESYVYKYIPSLKTNTSKKQKRLVVFAGYDRRGIINDYVIYHLKELKKVADIIFVYDNSLYKKELDKIAGLTMHNICKSHGEYDFGSYKRGYLWAKEQGILENYDSLTLCNDSCFGPFEPLLPIYEKFEKDGAGDFFGTFFMRQKKIHPIRTGYASHIENKYIRFLKKAFINKRRMLRNSYLESYFVVLKKHMFLSYDFNEFITNIKKEKNKQSVFYNGEQKLSKIFLVNGFKCSSLFEGDSYTAGGNASLKFIEKGYPFLKKTLFNPYSHEHCVYLEEYKNFIPDTYNVKYIEDYLNQNIGKPRLKRYLVKMSEMKKSNIIKKQISNIIKKYTVNIKLLGIKNSQVRRSFCILNIPLITIKNKRKHGYKKKTLKILFVPVFIKEKIMKN
jgi:lipopolysaccharide biosynthesis protein